MITTVTDLIEGRTMTLAITLAEDDAGLNYMSALVTWGDGETSTVARTLKVADQVVAEVTHTYAIPGFYVVSVAGRNYRSPVSDVDTQYVYANVGVSLPVRQVNRGFIRGPVLPGEVDNWAFNLSSDVELIKSNLMSLLLTRIGERLMYPEIGTRLSSLVFDQDDTVVEAAARDDISNAVAQYEPRASLVSVAAERSNREMNLLCQFSVGSEPFTIGLNFG